MPEGLIAKGIGGFYYVKTLDGEFECKARGVFRREDITPLPGDLVNIAILNEEAKTGNITHILPRTSILIRPAVANINQLIIVVTTSSPELDVMLLEKLVITAEKKDITPVICINKIDLDHNNKYLKILNSYQKVGYKVICTSFKNNEFNENFDELKSILKGKISAFAGQSGVGKSTILNKIMGEWLMSTGEMSNKILRGKHTTRHAQLWELNEGGYILDTPGFSSFELMDIKYNELENYFPEFKQHIGKCKYTGCSHILEPHCEIKDAVNNGFICSDRYDRYTNMYEELKKIKEYPSKKRR